MVANAQWQHFALDPYMQKCRSNVGADDLNLPGKLSHSTSRGIGAFVEPPCCLSECLNVTCVTRPHEELGDSPLGPTLFSQIFVAVKILLAAALSVTIVIDRHVRASLGQR
jgi:hypothetical protein